jgi:hypothetical protein
MRHPSREAKRSSSSQLGVADQLGQPLELVLPTDLHDEPAVAGAERGP